MVMVYDLIYKYDIGFMSSINEKRFRDSVKIHKDSLLVSELIKVFLN